MVWTACSRPGWLSHQQLFPPGFVFSRALIREGDGCLASPMWHRESDFSLLPGSKGNPAFLSQSQGPFPRAGAGAGTGMLDGLRPVAITFPSMSRKQASPESLSLPVSEDCSQEEFGAKGWCQSSRVGSFMRVSRWETVSSFLAETWGITHSGGASG